MYSKQLLLKALKNEFRVLKHLGTKVENEQHLAHKFTEKQRTVRDLMVYIAYSFGKQVTLVEKGEMDMTIFADMGDLTANFDPSKWEEILDSEFATIEGAINRLSDEQLATEVTIFNNTQTRTEWLVSYLIAALAAYRMQLFLQLKHAGRTELGTSNVWGGVDPAPKAE